MESRKYKYFMSSIIDNYGGIWQCVCDTEKTLKLKILEEVFDCYFEEGEILTQKKDNNCCHTWREYKEDNDFVIYPYMRGKPYHFKPLTKEHLKKEIKDCKAWCVNAEFYEDLLKEIKE